MRLPILRFAALLLLAGCGTSAQTNSAAADGSAGAEGPANLAPSTPPFTSTAVATFSSPWAMAFLPGSTEAIVSEKPGRLWLVDVESGRKQEVSGAPRVVFGGQGGLLDVVAAPDFRTSRAIYLTYSEPSANGGSALALARARLVRGPGGARLDQLERLWHDPAGGNGGQFGGIVAFAPDGHSLFLSSGERQRFTPAQDASQPIGKILHLTLDGKPAPGNPWAGREGAGTVTVIDPPDDSESARDAPGRPVKWPGRNLTPAETWSLGHRNLYGLAFAPDGRLWETEMGPRGGDELNLILPGRNYGWPVVSEGKNYDRVPIPAHSTRAGFKHPKLYWVPSISPTSLLFYSGRLFPEWKGHALIGSLSGEALVDVRISGDQATPVHQWPMGRRIRFVCEGPDGAVYLLEDGDPAQMLRLMPAAGRTG